MNELLRAAKRIVGNNDVPIDSDEYALARRVIATVMEDDGEAATLEWIHGKGDAFEHLFGATCHTIMIVAATATGRLAVFMSDLEETEEVNLPLPSPVTRGVIRHLFAALGITLKESPNG